MTYETIGILQVSKYETITNILKKKFINVPQTYISDEQRGENGVEYIYHIYDVDNIDFIKGLYKDTYIDDGSIFTLCKGHLYKLFYKYPDRDPEYIHLSRVDYGVNEYPEVNQFKLYNFTNSESKKKFDIYTPNPVLRKHIVELGIEIIDETIGVNKGVFILEVSKDSPAENGGLAAGDFIKYIKRKNGVTYNINDVNDYKHVLAQLKDKEVIHVGVLRNDNVLDRTIIVESVIRKFTKYTTSRLLMKSVPDFFLKLNNLCLKYKDEDEHLFTSYFKIHTDVEDWKLKMYIPKELDNIIFNIDNKGNLVVYNG
ncbi:MAG: PDZ domain-containing protein [Lachnospiraceae bacterium]|nr:PDZ domain-containing protein [Lachnospiraceae bacterium]